MDFLKIKKDDSQKFCVLKNKNEKRRNMKTKGNTETEITNQLY